MGNNIESHTSARARLDSLICFILHVTVICDRPADRRIASPSRQQFLILFGHFTSLRYRQQTGICAGTSDCRSYGICFGGSEVKLTACSTDLDSCRIYLCVTDEPRNTKSNHHNSSCYYNGTCSKKSLPLIFQFLYLLICFFLVILRRPIFFLFVPMHPISPQFCCNCFVYCRYCSYYYCCCCIIS